MIRIFASHVEAIRYSHIQVQVTTSNKGQEAQKSCLSKD